LAVAATTQFEPVAASRVAEDARPSSSYQEPRFEHPALESEQVREFSQHPTPQEAAVPAGAGYAPAVPVKIDWPPNLQQVESDPEKIRSLQQEPVPQPSEPRPRRVRPVAQPVSEEPLVQIETDRRP